MLVTLQGTWTLQVKALYAALPSRFIISGANSGNGTYPITHPMTPLTVTGKKWTIAIQHDSGQGFQESETHIKFPVKNGYNYEFDIISTNGGSDTLILSCTTPVTIHDFLIYGHASSHQKNSVFNPGHLHERFVIDTPQGLQQAMKNEALRDYITRFYADRITSEPVTPFHPIVLPLSDELAPSQVQLLYKRLASGNGLPFMRISDNARLEMDGDMALEVFDLLKTLQTNVTARNNQIPANTAIAAVNLCKATKSGMTAPASFTTLSFETYERTSQEKMAGIYTAKGVRQAVGDTTTDMNGNFIFRFAGWNQLSETFARSPGDIMTVKLPDVMLSLKNYLSPYNTIYETIPYHNVTNLQRIDISLPLNDIPPAGRIKPTAKAKIKPNTSGKTKVTTIGRNK